MPTTLPERPAPDAPRTHRRHPRTRESFGILGIGILGGLIAATPMIFWWMCASSGAGFGFGLPPKEIAGTFLGVDVIIGGAWTIVFGLFLHYVMAIFWALVFAAFISRRTDPVLGFFVGLCYGAAVWAFMLWVIVPWADSVLSQRVALDWEVFFVAHLLFGLFLGFVPILKRRVAPAHARERVVVREPVPA